MMRKGSASRRLPAGIANLVTRRMERRLLRALDAGLGHRPDVEVARDLGVNRELMWKYRKILGLPLDAAALRQAICRRGRPCPTDGHLEGRVRSMALRGLSVSAIAMRLRVGPKRVRRIARSAGIAFTNPRSSIDWARLDWSAGDEEIARQTGIGMAMVAMMRERERGTSRDAGTRASAAEGTWRRYRQAEYAPLAERIRALAEVGMSLAAIARQIGETEQRVRYAAAWAGLHLPKPRGVDWSGVDWSRPDSEIAASLGVAARRVSAVRYLLAKPKGGRAPTRRPPSPRAVRRVVEGMRRGRAEGDRRLARRILPILAAGRSVSEASRIVRVSEKIVRRIARSAATPPGVGAPSRRKAARRPSREEWLAADWSLPREDIAHRMGVAAGTVTRMRAVLRREGHAIADAPGSNAPACRERRLRLWAELYAPELARLSALARRGETTKEMMRALGVSRAWIQKAARHLGVPLLGGAGADWSRVDWTRTNGDIARKLRLNRKYVGMVRRRLIRAGREIPPSPRRRERV